MNHRQNGNEKQQTSFIITVIIDKMFTYLTPATSKLIKEEADVTVNRNFKFC